MMETDSITTAVREDRLAEFVNGEEQRTMSLGELEAYKAFRNRF